MAKRSFLVEWAKPGKPSNYILYQVQSALELMDKCLRSRHLKHLIRIKESVGNRYYRITTVGVHVLTHHPEDIERACQEAWDYPTK